MSTKTHDDVIEPTQSHSGESIAIGKVELENDGEIFKRGEGIEDFRTVSWVHTSVIFLKCKQSPSYTMSSVPINLHVVIFATGVLTIPSAMFTLGAFPGAINVLGWQFLNTWCALIQGQFRNNHAGCHSIADMGNVVGGRFVKELAGILFLVAFSKSTAIPYTLKRIAVPCRVTMRYMLPDRSYTILVPWKKLSNRGDLVSHCRSVRYRRGLNSAQRAFWPRSLHKLLFHHRRHHGWHVR